MKNCFKALKNRGLLSFRFGLEREGLRVTDRGRLAMTPHPEAFGDKLTNPHITTDFSESQIELITPVCDSRNDAVSALHALTDQVNTLLPIDEFFWPYSMPCVITEGQAIPVARYPDNAKGREAMAYRQMLAEKYGSKKQLISGIHLNFSLSDKTLKAMHHCLAPFYALRDFKNQLYLKITRQLLRYRWLIIYLTGCSPICDPSFFDDVVALRDTTLPNAVSLRNSGFGYKNKKLLFPECVSVGTYVESIKQFVREGSIAAPKEFYAPVRLKSANPAQPLDALLQDGIEYLELRMIDLNPFEPQAIAEDDIRFIAHLILYLLSEQEADYADWQAEAEQNAILTAECGLDPTLMLKQNGQPVLLTDWAMQIIDSLQAFDRECQSDDDVLFNRIKERIEHPEKTYAARIRAVIEREGYTESLLNIAKSRR